ncbi:MAG: hypothetical protein AAFU54_11690 [Chloroflexota bacterium]
MEEMPFLLANRTEIDFEYQQFPRCISIWQADFVDPEYDAGELVETLVGSIRLTLNGYEFVNPNVGYTESLNPVYDQSDNILGYHSGYIYACVEEFPGGLNSQLLDGRYFATFYMEDVDGNPYIHFWTFTIESE